MFPFLVCARRGVGKSIAASFVSLLAVGGLVVTPLPVLGKDKDDKKNDDANAAQPRTATTGLSWTETPVRPAADQVASARALFDTLDSDSLKRLNALRFLANRPKDGDALQPWRWMPAFPELGKAEKTPEGMLEPWVLLRLTALLRCGYPSDKSINEDLKTWLSTAIPNKTDKDRWSDISNELMLLRALLDRSSTGFEPLSEKARERAQSIANRARWSSGKLNTRPDEWGLADLLHEAVSRRIVQDLKLKGKLGRAWDDTLDSLCDFINNNTIAEGQLWYELAGGTATDRLRKSIMLGVILSLAKNDDSVAIKGSFAKAHETCMKHVATLLRTTADSIAKERDVGGDETAMLALLDPALIPDSLGKRDSVLARAVATPTDFIGEASSSDSGLAVSLDWLDDPVFYDGRHMDPELPKVTAVCLGLLGMTGGLTGGSTCEVMTEEKLASVFDALTTVELSKAPSFNERTNVALTKAADWIKRQQLPDGGFPGHWNSGRGGQALALLALFSAGIERDDKSVVEGMKRLRALKVGTLQGDGGIYTAALTLMVLQKFYEPEQRTAGILDAGTPREYGQAAEKVRKALKGDDATWVGELVRTLTSTYGKHGWSYDGGAASIGVCDNSNSQYAVMGLKAAALLGAEFDRGVLLAEAERLLKAYTADPSLEQIDASPDDFISVTREGASRTTQGSDKKDEKPDTAKDKDKGKDKEEKDSKPNTTARYLVYPGGWEYWGGPEDVAIVREPPPMQPHKTIPRPSVPPTPVSSEPRPTMPRPKPPAPEPVPRPPVPAPVPKRPTVAKPVAPPPMPGG